MVSAREAAMLTLAACERQGAWADGCLKRILRDQKLDRRDAALATCICFGVMQNKLLIDWHLAAFCHSKLERLDINMLCNLRAAAYQLLFLGKIPASAAVNEAVELTRKHCRNPRAAGMVNGILRNMLRQEELSEPTGYDKVETLSLKYSHPRWLVEEFISALGLDSTQALLEINNRSPLTAAQVNTLRTDFWQLCEELRIEGVEAKPHPWLDNCLLLAGTGNLEQLAAFREGKFYVQDAAARLMVTASSVKPGDRVLDCCAAPGGKSFAAAIAMDNQGKLVSCDIHPHKVKLLEAGRDRLGLSIIQPCLQSATAVREEWLNAFDVVMTDVPCSGLGVIRKKPDIRYKDPEPLKGLPKVQRNILDNCCRYVCPGGTLIYSTCTLLRQENEDVVDGFLADHPKFVLEPFELPRLGVQPGIITFWPHIHGTDGFFVACLRRKE